MRWLLLCLIVIQAASCGQKGPLSLPEKVSAFGPGGAPAHSTSTR